MKLTLKELKAIICDAYDNGVSAMECAERASDLRRWRAEYVRNAIQAAKK